MTDWQPISSAPRDDLADRVEAAVQLIASKPMGVSLEEWNRISNVLLDAAKALRSPPNQGEG